MSSKLYRSALGKPVDMGALLLKNENVRAVGNMGVNAKGDVIDKKNETITSKAHQVNQNYRKQIRNQIEDVPVGGKIEVAVVDTTIEGFDTPLESTKEVVEVDSNGVSNPTPLESTKEVVEVAPKVSEGTPTKSKPKKGGLASAIAKAREVEQKKTETPREKSRGKKGVKKI